MGLAMAPAASYFYSSTEFAEDERRWFLQSPIPGVRGPATFAVNVRECSSPHAVCRLLSTFLPPQLQPPAPRCSQGPTRGVISQSLAVVFGAGNGGDLKAKANKLPSSSAPSEKPQCHPLWLSLYVHSCLEPGKVRLPLSLGLYSTV